ncbi:hypothetical protein [Nocardia sp. NPDC051750]|uniref:hypothetical protein n=1 Tax=Nocardia sp. NPDC051750 TaxID=3364325 RepID=UPI00378B57B7
MAALAPIGLLLGALAATILSGSIPDFIAPSSRSGAFMLAAPLSLVYGIVLARAAFSYARPILRARLDDDRTAIVVRAHPEFARALDEIRRKPPAASASTLW